MKSLRQSSAQVEPADYPTFVACADLGVSLHTSTSGLDLPIKILDYFGCEVPVVAYDFTCLQELVQDDVNGRTFTTSEQLTNIFWDLLSPLATFGPAETPGCHDFGDLQRYSRQIQGRALWTDSWPRHALPLLEDLVCQKRQEEKKDA
jgi:beta-1,4-mannosyltransferase